MSGDVPEQETAGAKLARLGTDAQLWAREFIKLAPPLDEGTMIGWFASAIETGRSAGQAATPDGPRRWALPDEPGPEVTAVRDEGGRLWRRHAGLWCYVNQYLGHSHRAWAIVVFDHGPLTDATPAADGQDGDGHG